MLFTRRGLLLWQLPSYARRNASRTPTDFLREMWIGPVAGAGAGRGIGRERRRHPVGTVAPRHRTHPVALVGVAPRGLVDQPAARTVRTGAEPAAAGVPARFGTANLALLRGFRRADGQLAAARQLPGIPGRRRRLAHLAHQHGHVAAGGPGRARFRLHPRRGIAAAASGNTLATMQALERYRGHFYNWYDTRTLQPLQPAIRLVGGQRQPGRQPAHAAGGARRTERPAGVVAQRVPGPAGHPAGACRTRARGPCPRPGGKDQGAAGHPARHGSGTAGHTACRPRRAGPHPRRRQGAGGVAADGNRHRRRAVLLGAGIRPAMPRAATGARIPAARCAALRRHPDAGRAGRGVCTGDASAPVSLASCRRGRAHRAHRRTGGAVPRSGSDGFRVSLRQRVRPAEHRL